MTTSESMRHTTQRRRRRFAPWLLAAVVGAGVGLTLTWQATNAAFDSTTRNPDNSLSTGTVTLADDDSGTAVFDAQGLVPGDSASGCITVTYAGSVPVSVKLYTAPGDSSGTLGSYLDLTVEEGTGGSFSGGCGGFVATSTIYSGTLAAFASTKTSFSTGVGAFTPTTNGDHVTYRFSYAVQDDNAAQNKSATISFTWEARA